jgi:hypothetical protein
VGFDDWHGDTQLAGPDAQITQARRRAVGPGSEIDTNPGWTAFIPGSLRPARMI